MLEVKVETYSKWQKSLSCLLSRNVMEVAADFLPYYDLLYIQVKQIIEKEQM